MPIGNKIPDACEEEFVRHAVEASGIGLCACLPYDVNIVKAEMSQTGL
jgi:hypothetical protein